jgi:hypothetical protein
MLIFSAPFQSPLSILFLVREIPMFQPFQSPLSNDVQRQSAKLIMEACYHESHLRRTQLIMEAIRKAI